jgi:apolipoprotein N-acyltransferase
VIKQAGQQDVDLLFVPSNDWPGVKDIHAGMAIFRAVENGMSIYRQTGSGVSSVIDAYGRTIHRVDAFQKDSAEGFAAVQIVITPIGSVKTLYPAVGDLLGNIMLILFVGLVAGLWWSSKHRSAPVKSRPVPV